MPGPTHNLASPPFGSAALILLIVARDQLKLYRRLQRRIGACPSVVPVFDRREADRRKAVQPVLVERRQGDRRSGLHPLNDLRHRKYMFARPHQRCAHD
jgi:hypothetical protein